MKFKLDRMALDDVGLNPARLAAAIHDQLGEGRGPVPVAEIARALDIIEIRSEYLSNFEGALVTTPERGYGSILVNRSSSKRRRRFTISHELLHFLNPLHWPTSPDGFHCSRQDMIANRLDAKDRHLQQESEANSFAIELLAPPARIKPYLRGEPDLAVVLSMSEDLDISKEAAARRYVARHGENLAVVFSRESRFLYADRSKDFPWLNLSKARELPALPIGQAGSGLSSIEEVDAGNWIVGTDGMEMTVQTLHQQAGHAITLLQIVAAHEDDSGGGIDDSHERFTRFGA